MCIFIPKIELKIYLEIACHLYTLQFQTLSLGQGQGEAAEKLIEEGIKSGDWILLQNCHLASAWLSNLVTIWEEVDFQVRILPLRISHSSQTKLNDIAY